MVPKADDDATVEYLVSIYFNTKNGCNILATVFVLPLYHNGFPYNC